MNRLKIFLLIGIVGLLSLSIISAMRIDFFYSPSCPHCQNVLPTIDNFVKQYTLPYYIWNIYDVSKGSYNVDGVPLIKIKTEDNREIEIAGDKPILQRLKCELNEQSTLECPTYSILEGTKDGSWFIN